MLDQCLTDWYPAPAILDPRQACTVATLFFEGYNNYYFKPRENKDGGYTNSFCTVAIISRLVDAVRTDDLALTKTTVNHTLAFGYCDNYIRDKILKRLSDAC